MTNILILVTALAFVFGAYLVRDRLRKLDFLTWIGWVLVGAGVPVLLGQVVSLLLLSQENPEAARFAGIALAVGLGGGLAWISACLSIRFTPAKKTPPDAGE